MSKKHIKQLRLTDLIHLIRWRFVMKNSNGTHGLTREVRLQIMLSPQELKAVDNFRFEHRMPSRAAAVRELLRHGIAAAGAVPDKGGGKSGDYSVLKAPQGARRRAPLISSQDRQGWIASPYFERHHLHMGCAGRL